MITLLGSLSFLFCVYVTARGAFYESHKGGQTMRDSLMEAWTNIAIGFSINYVANFLILPLVGSELTLANNFMLGWIYTAISFARQMVIRRYYNHKMVKKS